ncbi:MAG: outer membrane lipoprotein carrier protein LolA [Prevotella sp.]|nr:outer membrane lipoprotein carrier protein LolA [Prevotella sp.]
MKRLQRHTLTKGQRILLSLFCLLALSVSAQQVTKTTHKKAVKTDVVTTGTMTIRKPDYICISTDADKDLLIMDGTKFTMTMGGKKHTTDSRKNAQFATFHTVLKAVINGQPIPDGEELSVVTKNGQKTITITPAGKKRRQLFTSFVLVVDAKTSAFRTLRMNGRNEDYTEYNFK